MLVGGEEERITPHQRFQHLRPIESINSSLRTPVRIKVQLRLCHLAHTIEARSLRQLYHVINRLQSLPQSRDETLRISSDAVYLLEEETTFIRYDVFGEV